MDASHETDIVAWAERQVALPRESPSLERSLFEPDWRERVWADAVAKATEETGLDSFPDDCPWTVEEILSPDFYP